MARKLSKETGVFARGFATIRNVGQDCRGCFGPNLGASKLPRLREFRRR